MSHESPTPAELARQIAALQQQLQALEAQAQEATRYAAVTDQGTAVQSEGNVTATQGSIERVLNNWRLQAANVGGQLGLEALGLDGTFNLTDEDVIAILEARTAMLTDIDGDISIVRTTAIELGRRIFAQRLEGLTLADILARLPVYTASRSLQRSGNIAQSETVDASRTLLQEVYHRNGAETMIFRTQPELREDPVCPICDPYDGTEHPTTGRPGVSIPVHTMCNCYWDPVLPPEQPEEVWRG